MPLVYTLLPLLLCMVVVAWQGFSADPHSNSRDLMHNGWMPARLILEGQNPYDPNQQEIRRLAVIISPLVWATTLLGMGLAALVFVPTLLHFSLGQYSVIILFLLALLFLPRVATLVAVVTFALATMKPQLSALPLAILLLGWLLAARVGQY